MLLPRHLSQGSYIWRQEEGLRRMGIVSKIERLPAHIEAERVALKLETRGLRFVYDV